MSSQTKNSKDTVTIEAKCLCSTCHFTTIVPRSKLPLLGLACHCDSCRHLSGTLFTSGVSWPTELPSSPHLTKFAFSEHVNTYHCSNCGTQMFFEPDVQEENNPLCVESGALVDPGEAVKYTQQICIGDTKDGGASDWIAEVQGERTKRWEGLMEKTKELPIGWHTTDSKSDSPTKGDNGDTIKASCKCRGVEFYLTRPNEMSADLSQDLNNTQNPAKARAWWISGPNKDKYSTNICSCDSCRMAYGVDFISWAFVPRHNIRTAAGEPFSKTFGTLKTYKSSDRRTWCFCGKCGATAFLICEDTRPEIVDVAMGLLWSEKGARAEDWLAWSTKSISFESDGYGRPLSDGMRKGLKMWNEANSDQGELSKLWSEQTHKSTS